MSTKFWSIVIGSLSLIFVFAKFSAKTCRYDLRAALLIAVKSTLCWRRSYRIRLMRSL